MNYFELFELPVQLAIDKGILKKKYFELSRRYHPDYFVRQEADAQLSALDASAQVNKAYKTFSNQDETIKYVLEQKGLLTENEKYTLPPAFLMEMMELNETLADAQLSEAEKSKALEEIQELEADMYQPVSRIIEQYKDGITTEAELQEVKGYYFKKKYIERLKQQLGEKL